TVRWWSKSPGEFRQEFDRADGSDGGETTVVVGDGEQRHSYTARDKTYQSSDLPEVPEGVSAWPLPGGNVGPVPMQRGGSPQDAAFALVERWIPVRAGQPVAELSEGGGDTVAGRPARVFEAVGISCELAPPMPGSSSPTLGECGGYMRPWVDHETGFILR